VLLNGVLIAVILVPFVFFTLNNKRYHYHSQDADKENTRDFSRLKLFLDKRFCIIALSVFILPFMTTGLFSTILCLPRRKAGLWNG
jgi:Ca2+/Na+ antiporter